MKKSYLFIYILVILVMLTSCWDRRLLKEHSLILAIGYDLNEDETISKTVAFPSENKSNLSEDDRGADTEVMTTEGNTVGDSDIELERFLAQKFDRSKARVLLIGEKLAKYGMFPTLDSMYRDPRGPLNATVAIVKERADEGLNISKDQSFLTSEFYYNLIKSAEESGIVKRGNIQSICPILLSKRKDIVLPLLKVNDENTAFIEGLALFSGDKMVGELKKRESIMLLILADEITKKVKMNLRIDQDKEKREENYVTISIRKEKRKLNVHVENNEVKATIDLKLHLEVEEFPQDHLYKQAKVDKLEKNIKKQMTNIANETIETVQKINSDVFGIGDHVKAYHYNLWKKIDWKDVYPEIPIKVDFDINVIHHGIIN